MALKKIRFHWGTPPLVEGRWYLGLFNFEQIIDKSRPPPPAGVPAYWRRYIHHALHFSMRGLLAWGSLASLMAYLSGAALIWFIFERDNPHSRITYRDLVLPTRWKEHHRLRGESLIALGQEKLSAEQYGVALGLLRAGLARHPADASARYDLVNLYVALRLREPALRLIRDGLDQGYPGRAFLALAFAIAADADRPSEWVELCRRAQATWEALPPDERLSDDGAWLAVETIEALLADDRLAEARDELTLRADLLPAIAREEFQLRLLLLTGQAARAEEAAARWVAAEPGMPAAHRALVRAGLATGNLSSVDTALAALQALDPLKSESLVYALGIHYQTGRRDAARAVVEDLIFRHGANPDLYPPLAAALAKASAKEDLERVERELRELGYSLRPIHWARLEIAFSEQAWPEVLLQAQALRATPGTPLLDTQLVWLGTLEHLARACLDGGSGTQAALVENVADHPGTLRLYQRVLDALLAADEVTTAASILTLAEGPYPQARFIVERRTRIETRQAEIEAARPEASAAVAFAFDSFDAFEAAFIPLVSASRTDDALALLTAARRSRADWVDRATDRLNALQLPLTARGDDASLLQYLARNTLSRNIVTADDALRLARTVIAEGRGTAARILLGEILRQVPDHAEAVALLAILAPAAPRPGASSPTPGE